MVTLTVQLWTVSQTPLREAYSPAVLEAENDIAPDGTDPPWFQLHEPVGNACSITKDTES